MSESTCKIYVDVTASFSADGILRPLSIIWTDGTRYTVDAVRSCVRAASRKAGGTGLRYTVVIRGQETFLYYEENYRWFVEAKRQA